MVHTNLNRHERVHVVDRPKVVIPKAEDLGSQHKKPISNIRKIQGSL